MRDGKGCLEVTGGLRDLAGSGDRNLSACEDMEHLKSESASVRPYDLPVIQPAPPLDSYLYDDDFEDEPDAVRAPASLYSNMTVVTVTKASWGDKAGWLASEMMDPAPASSSGTFSRLVRTTVRRKPEKRSLDTPEAHLVTLNLHQFHTDAGDSLGEDPEGWAKLTF